MNTTDLTLDGVLQAPFFPDFLCLILSYISGYILISKITVIWILSTICEECKQRECLIADLFLSFIRYKIRVIHY